MRKNIDWDKGIEIVARQMGDDDPHATQMVMTMAQANGMEVLKTMDDMNIRGHQVLAAITRYCENNLHLFIEKVKVRDPGLVDWLNTINHPEWAVTEGAIEARKE